SGQHETAERDFTFENRTVQARVDRFISERRLFPRGSEAAGDGFLREGAVGLVLRREAPCGPADELLPRGRAKKMERAGVAVQNHIVTAHKDRLSGGLEECAVLVTC